MNKSDFNYDLPKELIAQSPSDRRDESKLLVVNRKDGSLSHKKFKNVIDYLEKGDVLVLNDTKVMPARIFGRKNTGANVEFLLLKNIVNNKWRCLCRPAKRAKIGDEFIFSNELKGVIVESFDDGIKTIDLKYIGNFYEILDSIGTMPLPPYIEYDGDMNRYQTIYAKYVGSAAAPTAGLHFTDELIEKIKKKGILIAYVTLHVGLGTFRGVKTEKIEEHKMHSEVYELTEENAKIINSAKRVVAVGTTSVRTLESVYRKNGKIVADKDETDIFIYPGYKFNVVNTLITNFHLPESTLIMLVSAFYERKKIIDAYNNAINNKYRFFSFGDSMIIL